MLEKAHQEGLTVRTLLAAAIAVFVSAAVPAAAQTYDWTNDVPPNLAGTWAEMGQSCEDDNSQLVIYSDGGYRWRRSRTDWGFARGQFSYTGPQPYTVFFRVRRLDQHESPDFQLAISGDQLRIYSFGSGRERRLEKCKD